MLGLPAVLPPLFGFPWESRSNGQAPGMLFPLVVAGAPLTKVQGQTVQINWGARNSGGASGLVELYLTNKTTAAARFLRTGSQAVFAGDDLPLTLIWNTGPVTPGTYLITIGIDEVAVGGAFVRNLAAEDFSVTINSLPAALVAIGSPSVV